MAKKQNVQIPIDVDVADIGRIIGQRVEAAVCQHFDAAFKDAIKGQVADLVKSVTVKRIEAAVDAALEEGWQGTNTYGEPIGPKLGLKGRIAEMLTKQEGDYNRRVTRVDRIAAETIDAALRAEFGKDITAARERFKAQLDAVVAAKFTETIKAALGLR